jgi:hypothetical protein
MAIVTVEEIKTWLRIPASVITSDAELQLMIDAVTLQIENITGGPLINRTVVERVQATSNYRTLALRERPIVSVDSIVDIASGTAMTITDLDIDANSGIVRRKLDLAFYSRGPYYTVTYTAGWGTTLLPTFNLAARIIVARLWQIRLGLNSPPQHDPYTPPVVTPISQQALELLAPYAQEAYL